MLAARSISRQSFVHACWHRDAAAEEAAVPPSLPEAPANPTPLPSPSLSPPPPVPSPGEWPEQRRDDQRTGNNALQTTITKANVGTLKIKWTQNFFGERAEPVVSNGIVYIADVGGFIYAFDENTGAIRWKFLGAVGVPFKATPAIVNGILYDGSVGSGPRAGAMYAVNASSGTLLWQHNYNEPYRALNGSPIFANGRIFAGRSTNNEAVDCDANGQLMAYDPSTGVVLDQLNLTAPPVTGDDIWSGAMVDPSGALYVATGNPCGALSNHADAIIKLGSKPLSVIWTTQASTTDNGTLDYDYGATPLYVNGMVVDGNKNGNLYAFNPLTGAVIWATQLGNEMIASPASDGSKIFATVNQVGIFALDMAGHVIWSVHSSGETLAPVAVSNGIVFAAYNQGVSALDADTGAVLWRFQGSHNIQDGPTIVSGGLFFGEFDGPSFYAFTPNGQ